jgi:hypothetical protein
MMPTSRGCLFCLALAATRVAGDCEDQLGKTERQRVQTLIEGNDVVLFGLHNYRCTMYANEALPVKDVCYHEEVIASPNSPLRAYLTCLHPNVGWNADNMDHSFLYVNGKYVGDGFKAQTADFSGTAKGCGTGCSSLLPAASIAELEDVVAHSPVALYGWGGCPCTAIARNRFEADGVCFMQNVWPDWESKVFKYLQCKYGDEHHSFVFFGGEFFGDGFKLGTEKMSDTQFKSLLGNAGARLSCTNSGDLNLVQTPIQSCTQSNDGTTTGWTRTGSCNWAPSDSGYHEVCVTMSDAFLDSR